VEIHWTNLDGLEEKDRQGAEIRFRKLAASHNDLIQRPDRSPDRGEEEWAPRPR